MQNTISYVVFLHVIAKMCENFSKPVETHLPLPLLKDGFLCNGASGLLSAPSPVLESTGDVALLLCLLPGRLPLLLDLLPPGFSIPVDGVRSGYDTVLFGSTLSTSMCDGACTQKMCQPTVNGTAAWSHAASRHAITKAMVHP